MSRDLPFVRYVYRDYKSGEVPMHHHRNGQLTYVHEGIVHLRSPDAAWVVPRQRLIWIAPDQPHSVRGENVSGSWKVMIPRKLAKLLPEDISVLQTTKLLLAALESLPESGSLIAKTRLRLLTEIVKAELSTAIKEEFGLSLPQSKQLQEVTTALLQRPADPRRIDEWANELGLSRRSFTRLFQSETGTSFDQWRKNVRLNHSLVLLSGGASVSDVAETLGYAYPSAFIAAFKKRYGTSARKFTRR